MHERFLKITRRLLAKLLAMQPDALQRYVHDQSAAWRNHYLQNRDAIVNYLEMIKKCEGLGKDASVRAGVNAVVRLVREFGCARERYFDAVNGGYDWEAAQEADRVLRAALKTGCDLGELVSEAVIDGKVDLARVEELREDFASLKMALVWRSEHGMMRFGGGIGVLAGHCCELDLYQILIIIIIIILRQSSFGTQVQCCPSAG